MLNLSRRSKQDTNIYSRIFDAEYYLKINEDVMKAQVDPLTHYLKHGHKEGRYPHPLFDPSYYRERYMGGNTKEEPLRHYLENTGATSNPHPLFDGEYYAKQLHSPVSKTTLLEHFLKDGWKKNISPTPHFNFGYYYHHNKDVMKTGINGLIHYIMHGEAEGRWPNEGFFPVLYDKPEVNDGRAYSARKNETKLALLAKGALEENNDIARFLKRMDTLEDDKPIAIFVTHEATRTGAPLIILELANHFRKYLNVQPVCLVGFDGDIFDDFDRIGPTYRLRNWNPGGPEITILEASSVISAIAQRNPIGALVNSAESRCLLPIIKGKGIPTVSLIHEMAFVYPHGSFGVIADHSDKVIFPSKMVHRLANDNYHFPIEKVTVRGQGLLKPGLLKLDKEKARARLRKELDLPEDAFIVLGCGTITRRKAPEFFVQAAYNLLDEGLDMYFVWLGGYHPLIQESYYWMFRDIKVKKLEKRIQFVGSKSESQDYFMGSDIFFMTSRADPFPCVIHEAMASEIPIIGFRDAGGFTEALEGGCGDVVDYANTGQASEKIREWYEDDARRKAIGKKAKAKVISDYNYITYTLDVAEKLCDAAMPVVDKKKTNINKLTLAMEEVGKEFAATGKDARTIKKVIFTLASWELSGVNTFVENAVAELNKLGYDAYILFTTNHSKYMSMEYMPEVPFQFLGCESSDFQGVWHKLKEHLSKCGPCVYVPNHDYIASAICADLPDDVGILGVLHSDDTEHYEHTYRLGRYWNQIVSVSNTIEGKMKAYNPLFKDKSSVIYYGIQSEKEDKMPKKNKTFSIVYTGRIVAYQKRIFDFIPIIELLDEKGIDFQFTFIGDGPDEYGMKGLLSKYVKTKQVRFLGRQPMDVVYKELAKSHVFALASDFEGLPLSVLEALANYCVPVVTDIESGISEVIEHGKNGLVSPINDPVIFVENLLSIAKDEALREKLAVNAFKTLTEYKLRKADMAAQYGKVIDKIYDEITSGDYVRPKPLTHNSPAGNLLLPPMLQKIPKGYAPDGSII